MKFKTASTSEINSAIETKQSQLKFQHKQSNLANKQKLAELDYKLKLAKGQIIETLIKHPSHHREAEKLSYDYFLCECNHANYSHKGGVGECAYPNCMMINGMRCEKFVEREFRIDVEIEMLNKLQIDVRVFEDLIEDYKDRRMKMEKKKWKEREVRVI